MTPTKEQRRIGILAKNILTHVSIKGKQITQSLSLKGDPVAWPHARGTPTTKKKSSKEESKPFGFFIFIACYVL